MTVDEYVQASVPLQFHEVVATLRRLMRDIAPEAIEEIAYGMPVYKGNRIFAWIRPTRKDISFAFSRGVELEDRFALLRGKAKASRHLSLDGTGPVPQEALTYYVQQALALDKR